MNKKVLFGAAAGCAAAGFVVAATRKGQCQAEPKPTFWEKMRQGMEEMPEDFPPRIMFDNVEATKANTEAILELLRDEGAPGKGAGGAGTQREDMQVNSST